MFNCHGYKGFVLQYVILTLHDESMSNTDMCLRGSVVSAFVAVLHRFCISSIQIFVFHSRDS
jgi:hypothetical protein